MRKPCIGTLYVYSASPSSHVFSFVLKVIPRSATVADEPWSRVPIRGLHRGLYGILRHLDHGSDQDRYSLRFSPALRCTVPINARQTRRALFQVGSFLSFCLANFGRQGPSKPEPLPRIPIGFHLQHSPKRTWELGLFLGFRVGVYSHVPTFKPLL